MDWKSFGSDLLTGTVAGIVATIASAAIVYLFDWNRNRHLERSLREALIPKGIGYAIGERINFRVSNPTLQEVKIRSIMTRGGENGNHTISFSLAKDLSSKGVTEDEYGWVTLPPHSEGTWAFKHNALHGFPGYEVFLPIKQLVVTVEYATIFGHVNIIEISPTPQHSRYMLQGVEEFLRGEFPTQRAAKRSNDSRPSTHDCSP